MNNLERLTGQQEWPKYLAYQLNKKINEDLSDNSFEKLISTWFQLLENKQYPTETEQLTWIMSRKKKKSFAYNDGTSKISSQKQIFPVIDKLQKPSSLLTLVARLNSSNLRGESPIAYLNTYGDRFLVSLYEALRETMDEQSAIADINKNLIDYVVQFFQEKKMLVNTFPYWRIWSFMSKRIDKAITVIDEGGDIKQLVGLCGMFDPTAGWGCRLTTVLLVKALLMKKVRESGKYSDSDIEWLADVPFYIGCDTNLSLQPVYKQLNDVICSMYGLSTNSSIVHCVDCVSESGIHVAKSAIDNGITVLQTSIPTPWEIYRDTDGNINHGDSLLSANFNINSENLHNEHRKWIIKFLHPFMKDLVSLFDGSHGNTSMCAIIHADGYSVKYIKDGKPNVFKCELGKHIVDIANTENMNIDEICSAWDDPIKSPRCRCSAIACKKCDSCKKYSVCNAVECNQANKCYSYQLRSAFILGEL